MSEGRNGTVYSMVKVVSVDRSESTKLTVV